MQMPYSIFIRQKRMLLTRHCLHCLRTPKQSPSNIKFPIPVHWLLKTYGTKLGDYDMNDVMVKYTSTMTRNALDNRIYEIEDKFILQHCGGYLQNGFGYQLHSSQTAISRV